jgi:hypothetical protein
MSPKYRNRDPQLNRRQLMSLGAETVPAPGPRTARTFGGSRRFLRDFSWLRGPIPPGCAHAPSAASPDSCTRWLRNVQPNQTFSRDPSYRHYSALAQGPRWLGSPIGRSKQ